MRFFYRILLKGFLTLLPITLTIYLLSWAIRALEAALRETLVAWLPNIPSFPGFSLFFALAIVFLVGLLVESYVTKRFFPWLERQLERTPLVRSIYSPLRDVTNLFIKVDPGSNQRVVLVELDSPQTGAQPIQAMGLITRDNFSDLPENTIPKDSVAVFMPFSYGVGGYTLIVPKSRVHETDLAADRAMQLALTGWIKTNKT